MNEEALQKEKENLILYSISKVGFAAIPQDHSFLCKYSLSTLYYELIKSKTENLYSEKYIETAIKKQCSSFLDDECLYENLRELRFTGGNKKVKSILDNNKLYWSTLLVLWRKNKK